MSVELVKSVSIENLVNQREAVRNALEVARAALVDAQSIIHRIVADCPGRSVYGGAAQLVCSRGHAHTLRLLDDDGVADGMKEFDAMAWRYLMHASGLRSLMDARAREDWDGSIEKGNFPALTLDNIVATFRQLHDARADMFERGVVNVFRRLSWNYKTNLPQKFGKRIVLTGVAGTYSSHGCDALDDLMRVMHVLDGKPEPDHRTGGAYALMAAAGLTYANRRGVVDTDYYHLRTFKNLSGHLTFKRLDLVDKMNAIIAKHYPDALPRAA